MFSKTKLTKEQAALIIQKKYRCNRIKKKYGIEQLQRDEQAPYKAFAVGNDPLIVGLEKYKSEGPMALVALSGMRAIALACELGDPKYTPKVILIDNSRQVYHFWNEIREYTRKHASEEKFLEQLPQFFDYIQPLYRKITNQDLSDLLGVKYLDQDPVKFLKNLVAIYGYKYVRGIILKTTFIKQSWADASVFSKAKNILNYLNINNTYVYASDIVNLLRFMKKEAEADLILRHIANLRPVLSIHFDYCEVHHHPEKVFLFNKQNPDLVKKTLSYQDQNPSWLHIAAQNGYLDLVEDLLENENDKEKINERRDDGSTALLVAIEHNHKAIVEYLLKNGADPNIPRHDGSTPLYIAVQNADIKLVDLLLQHKTFIGKSLQPAQAASYEECKNILLKEMEQLAPKTPRLKALKAFSLVAKNAKSPAIYLESLLILLELDHFAKKLLALSSDNQQLIDSVYRAYASNPHDDHIVDALKSKMNKPSLFNNIKNIFSFGAKKDPDDKPKKMLV